MPVKMQLTKRIIIKLLERLKLFPEPHKGKFICAAVYYFGADFIVAMGEIAGSIIKEPRGTNGFGYDPFVSA